MKRNRAGEQAGNRSADRLHAAPTLLCCSCSHLLPPTAHPFPPLPVAGRLLGYSTTLYRERTTSTPCVFIIRPISLSLSPSPFSFPSVNRWSDAPATRPRPLFSSCPSSQRAFIIGVCCHPPTGAPHPQKVCRRRRRRRRRRRTRPACTSIGGSRASTETSNRQSRVKKKKR